VCISRPRSNYGPQDTSCHGRLEDYHGAETLKLHANIKGKAAIAQSNAAVARRRMLGMQTASASWQKERSRLNELRRPKGTTKCEVCAGEFASLAVHQVKVNHGHIWEERQNESGSAKKRRLPREWRGRYQQKSAFANEICNPSTVEMAHMLAETIPRKHTNMGWAICDGAA
jgi:hypothetical protein